MMQCLLVQILEIAKIIFWGWLTLEMIKLDNDRAILQSFHELAKLFFLNRSYEFFII